MSICDHGIDPKICMLCKKLSPQPPPQNHVLPGPAKSETENTLAADMVVQVMNTVAAPAMPIITDPKAKNILQLAQEYAQAQNDVAALQDNVKQLTSQLEASKIKLLQAEADCNAKQSALASAVASGFIVRSGDRILGHTATAAAVRIPGE